jgi:thiosulfate/3-mercaptopyruvate sulfurtransferase
MPSRNFISTSELAAELGDPDLGVIDASWHLPAAGRIGAAEFLEGHIPGAVFFDIDTIADVEQGLPHMLPKPGPLAEAMSSLGLGDGMRFAVYDVLGLYAAARVWWTLRAYRVEEVRILDGGLPKWVKEVRPLEFGAARARPPRPFTPRLDESFVASLAEVREALATGLAQVVDARPAERFRGETPEPRAGLKSGHMPGALNLPFSEIVEHGRLKAPEALKAAFAEHWIDLAKPIITTCGSGVTAAILALAVEEAGGKVEGLYDGSWAEWGSRDDCQVTAGPM